MLAPLSYSPQGVAGGKQLPVKPGASKSWRKTNEHRPCALLFAFQQSTCRNASEALQPRRCSHLPGFKVAQQSHLHSAFCSC